MFTQKDRFHTLRKFQEAHLASMNEWSLISDSRKIAVSAMAALADSKDPTISDTEREEFLGAKNDLFSTLADASENPAMRLFLYFSRLVLTSSPSNNFRIPMTLNQHETKTKSKITRYQIRAASIPLDLNGACPSR